MVLWHKTEDASRSPEVVKAGQPVAIRVGTYPIEPGQEVFLDWELKKANGQKETGRASVRWQKNDESRNNSYWITEVGPFAEGDRVQYAVSGLSPNGPAQPQTFEFAVATSAKPQRRRSRVTSKVASKKR